MRINHKIISDKELYEKSIDVVEFLANAKINLQIFSNFDKYLTLPFKRQ